MCLPYFDILDDEVKTAEIRDLVSQGKEGKISALLIILHELGGWTVLAGFCFVVVYFTWTAREKTVDAYVQEIKENKSAAWQIISQSADTQRKATEVLDRNTSAITELKEELRRARLSAK